MKLARTLMMVLLAPMIMGFADCNVIKAGFFEYDLTECPRSPLPDHVAFGEWGIDPVGPDKWQCSGFKHYQLADEKWRSGGGFGRPRVHFFNARVTVGHPCKLLLVLWFDGRFDPPDGLRRVADLAVEMLLKEGGFAPNFSARPFHVIGRKPELAAWCAQVSASRTGEVYSVGQGDSRGEHIDSSEDGQGGEPIPRERAGQGGD